jgi:tRNA pseudouridine38-40 synthase
MARFKLLIEYQGTRFKGWQMQKDLRSVQGELLSSAFKVFETERLEIYGAGRTDSGVHALGQVAHLDVATDFHPDLVLKRLNHHLPHDINVIRAENAHPKFHARHDAIARSYIYLISTRRNAFAKDHVWWVRDKLNVKAMQECASILQGFHDFSSFSYDPKAERDTRVELMRAQVVQQGSLIIIHFMASHFLWKMVRRMVGTMMAAAQGELEPRILYNWLEVPNSESGKLTVPASGLFLERVYYPGEKVQDFRNPFQFA